MAKDALHLRPAAGLAPGDSRGRVQAVPAPFELFDFPRFFAALASLRRGLMLAASVPGTPEQAQAVVEEQQAPRRRKAPTSANIR